jgi:hypothetical protein
VAFLIEHLFKVKQNFLIEQMFIEYDRGRGKKGIREMGNLGYEEFVHDHGA